MRDAEPIGLSDTVLDLACSFELHVADLKFTYALIADLIGLSQRSGLHVVDAVQFR